MAVLAGIIEIRAQTRTWMHAQAIVLSYNRSIRCKHVIAFAVWHRCWSLLCNNT